MITTTLKEQFIHILRYKPSQQLEQFIKSNPKYDLEELLPDICGRYTPITFLCRNLRSDIIDIYEKAELLIKAGAKLNVFHTFGINFTPLHEAVLRDDVKMSKILLDNGATPNNLTSSISPFQLAVKKEQQELCELMLEYGAKLIAKMSRNMRTANNMTFKYCDENPKMKNIIIIKLSAMSSHQPNQVQIDMIYNVLKSNAKTLRLHWAWELPCERLIDLGNKNVYLLDALFKTEFDSDLSTMQNYAKFLSEKNRSLDLLSIRNITFPEYKALKQSMLTLLLIQNTNSLGNNLPLEIMYIVIKNLADMAVHDSKEAGKYFDTNKINFFKIMVNKSHQDKLTQQSFNSNTPRFSG